MDTLPEATEIKTPIQYFNSILDDEFFELLVKETNLYSTQNNPNKPASISVREMEQFIGIACFMSIYKLPRQRMFWGITTRIGHIADVMSVNRWELIKKNVHLNDNSKQPARDSPDYDKLYKIRPLITLLNNRFSALPKGEFLSVDEQIVPFKGRSALKQYNPKKPRKWGYTIFVLADATGMMYKFEVFCGREKHNGLPDVGAAGNVVIRLAESIPKNRNYKLYFDNWFNGIKLQVELAKSGIYSLRTVRSNRLRGCTFSNDKEFKRKGRGSFEERKASVEGVSLFAIKWYDNKSVTTLSSFAGAYSCETKTRWNRASKEYISIQCPSVINLYNKSMGEVDLLDSLLALYRITIRSKKWYTDYYFILLTL